MLALQRHTAGAALAAVLTICGCASPRAAAESARGERVVAVHNYNWADMQIYLLRSGSRVRIGSVVSMQQATLQLPTSVNGSTQVVLLADPIGGGVAIRTMPVVLGTGRVLEWRIENSEALSRTSVR